MNDNRILYFDDEPYISNALATSLELLNWTVTLVSDIDRLFEELFSDQYHILMLDIMAPIPDRENKFVSFTNREIDEMNEGINTGIIIANKIWNMQKYKDKPIMFLSARQQPDSIKQFKETGKICDYLRKPELARTVDDKLHQLIKQKKELL